MKTLVIGIDGLGDASIKALGLRRLTEFLKQGKMGHPKIDNVVSRGWPELYSGKTAYETGAFYVRPEFGGRRLQISKRTGLAAVLQTTPAEELLWNKLGRNGESVSVFTLPTVPVLHDIGGFSVAGTGGGKFGNALVAADLSPAGLFQRDEFRGVDLGLRMGFGAWLPQSVDELASGVEAHLTAYFRLLKMGLTRCRTAHLVMGTRFVSEMSYKFIGLLEDSRYENGSVAKSIKAAVFELAKRFDELVVSFIEECNATHVFIVSDHGIKSLRWHVNLNEILLELGYLSRASSTPTNFLRPKVRRIRASLRHQVAPPDVPRYSLEKSLAFSPGFTDVLHLGPARQIDTAKSRRYYADALVEQLSDWLRTHPQEAIRNFHPIPELPREHRVVPFEFPDVRAVLSEGAFNSGRHWKPVQPFVPNFESILTEGYFGEYSGTKAQDTLAAYVGPDASIVDLSSLTAISASITTVAS